MRRDYEFLVLCTFEILKTFEICTFFYEKWMLPHIFAVPKVCHRHASMP